MKIFYTNLEGNECAIDSRELIFVGTDGPLVYGIVSEFGRRILNLEKNQIDLVMCKTNESAHERIKAFELAVRRGAPAFRFKYVDYSVETLPAAPWETDEVI